MAEEQFLPKPSKERIVFMKRNIGLLVLPCLLILSIACSSQTGRVEPDKKSPATSDADNTSRNVRDRDGTSLTPGDQAENEADRQISAAVRQAIVDDNSLSMNAHNVKIITSGGVVTLRGPVNSPQEKAAIETKAKQVAGVTRVDNFLEVEANR
jgi:hyperosmotically inducible protein